MNRVGVAMDTAYTLRNLTTIEEFEQVGRLQQRAIGLDRFDVFPPKLMTVADKISGTVVGLFDAAGEMVGFVLNFPGRRYGRVFEYSYLIAVEPSLRGRGLERWLKRQQRLSVLQRGQNLLCWVFDPLDVGAARRNLHDLGAISREYLIDFPDPTSGALYRIPGTDRVFVVWVLDDPAVAARLEAGQAREIEVPDGASIIDVRLLADGLPPAGEPVLGRPDAVLAFPVPSGLESRQHSHPELVESWRRAAERAFTHYFGRGYVAVDVAFRPQDPPDWGWYVLVKGPAPGAGDDLPVRPPMPGTGDREWAGTG